MVIMPIIYGDADDDDDADHDSNDGNGDFVLGAVT